MGEVSDTIRELTAIADGYKKILATDSTSALIGLQLEARMRKALMSLGGIDTKMQQYRQQLNANAEDTMAIQRTVEAAEVERLITTKCAAKEANRVPLKRKFHEPSEDGEDEDEGNWSENEYECENQGASDDETLMEIFHEVQSLVTENPKCTGKTPIGIEFDCIRKLIQLNPPQGDDETGFLLEIKERAELMVDKLQLDGPRGIPAAFARIRALVHGR